MLRIPTLVLFVLSSLGLSPALAQVEVLPVDHQRLGRVLVAKVSADIAPGDYETLLKGLRDHPGHYQQKLLLLDSIGGSVPEALRMGRLLRETGFVALVASNAVCQGSCVYLLAAGQSRTIRGAVGLHRPAYPGADSSLGAEQARQQHYNPQHYLREMGVSAQLFRDMQAIAPHSPRLLSALELSRYGLH